MHISPAFTFDSAAAGLAGGMCIGAVAAAKLWRTRNLMPCATPNFSTTPGMVLGSMALAALVAPSDMFEATLDLVQPWKVAVSGVLVGLGAGLGKGCTSGNGIQGLAALSPASFVFVGLFMVSGAATAALTGASSVLSGAATAVPLASVAPLLAIAVAGIVAQGIPMAPAVAKDLLLGSSFAAALIVSGMVKPSRVIGFLDVLNVERGWDPTLAFVMGGGLVVTLPAYQLAGLLGKSSASVQTWAKRPIDWAVVVGGLLFGAGWGCAGLCPGPALVACGSGSRNGVLFVTCMFSGRHVGISATSSAATKNE